MLVRICCRRCSLKGVWTVDPHGLLGLACLDRRRCEALLAVEIHRHDPKRTFDAGRDLPAAPVSFEFPKAQ